MLPTLLIYSWFAVPVVVWAALLPVGRRIHTALVCVLCLVSMIGGVFLLANYVWALDAQLLAEIEKYEPGTPEAERASEEWASDTDRSFLLLLSPILTGIWYAILFGSLFGIQLVVRHVFPTQHTSEQTTTDSPRMAPHRDDGNPYQSSTLE